MVKKYPLSAFSVRYLGNFGLISLARKAASAFKSGTHYQWWQHIIYAYVPVKSVDCIISHTLTVLVENPIGLDFWWNTSAFPGIASLPDSAKHRSLTRDAILLAARNGIPEIVHEIVV
ncbi:hypothetical protein RHGRI_037976 [Rhododendron griersonianum]|uniref:Uncharacterized protein n=1 Tax=Rhododendron griersonianum TaxID=479676 RepID=A0AAV6HZN1_9ERIC|nr:hypothetical protein RHGRI_037976 [Rhododendron griersonianum]